MQLIHDYFHVFEDKIIPEAPGSLTVDIGWEGEEVPPVELLTEGADPTLLESYTYPRVERTFEKALRA